MLSNSLQKYSELFDQTQQDLLQEYFEFLRFPSLSADPTYRQSIYDCLHWLVQYLEKLNFDIQIWETPKYPVLYATYCKAGPDKPTILLYHHYDVQPPDPVDLWKTKPFEPVLKEDGQVYARGAQDNKGQCLYILTALKLMIEETGNLPVNIKLCIEGEEESGSYGLSHILPSKKEFLKADYLFVVDVGMQKPNIPAVTLGLRGIVTMDVTVTAAKIDLHSGSHGGIAYNAIHALVELLAKLRDSEGKIQIPGFYDNVQDLTSEEKAFLQFDFDSEQYEKMFGAKPNGGEKVFSPLESNWLRPTLEINGVYGGYTGIGFKTVIPAKAHAKVSCRLVPGQDPQVIGKNIAEYLCHLAPEGIQVEVHIHAGGGIAIRSSPKTSIIQIVAEAYSEVCGNPCQFILEGASIPIVAQLSEICEGQPVLWGYGLPGDQIHAPNEHFGWNRFKQGYLTMVRILQLVAEKAG
ncbi:MAG: cNDP2 [Chlamydiales bacterium]|nr:cNDP2 [Chlamydiales bacterium]